MIYQGHRRFHVKLRSWPFESPHKRYQRKKWMPDEFMRLRKNKTVV